MQKDLEESVFGHWRALKNHGAWSMSEVAHNTERDFWRPPAVAVESSGATSMVEVCACGAEFVPGARFCHACGATRSSEASPLKARGWARYLEFNNIQTVLGLGTPSLLAFVLGLLCLIAAVAVGFIFSAQTVLDWQAVQMWRIQWLLGSVAAFGAGCLLKKSQ
jgi:hypothetical protein